MLFRTFLLFATIFATTGLVLLAAFAFGGLGSEAFSTVVLPFGFALGTVDRGGRALHIRQPRGVVDGTATHEDLGARLLVEVDGITAVLRIAGVLATHLFEEDHLRFEVDVLAAQMTQGSRHDVLDVADAQAFLVGNLLFRLSALFVAALFFAQAVFLEAASEDICGDCDCGRTRGAGLAHLKRIHQLQALLIWELRDATDERDVVGQPLIHLKLTSFGHLGFALGPLGGLALRMCCQVRSGLFLGNGHEAEVRLGEGGMAEIRQFLLVRRRLLTELWGGDHD